METNKKRIERFATSLASAILDKELEISKTPVLFFLDADVIIKLVLGFEAELDPLRKGFSKNRVVRALFSCGYLGNFYILRPHAFEFSQTLRNLPKYKSEADHIRFYRNATQYIEKTGIQGDLEKLSRIVSGISGNSKESHDEIVEKFISLLRERPSETFAYIEQINGTWSERLRRYIDNKLLNLDNLGPEVSDLVIKYGKVLNETNSAIRVQRPEMPLNDFQDAAALTILFHYIIEKENENVDFFVRFYTETMGLKKALIGDTTLQKRLSYRTKDPYDKSHLQKGNFIFRDSDYFIIRTMFRELSPVSAIDDIKKLAPLNALSSKLQSLLKPENEQNLEKALSSVFINGNTLMSLIDQFENLLIMKPLWMSGQIPKVIEETQTLKQWVKIFDFAKENRTKAVLNTKIDDFMEKIESQVSLIRQWTNDFRIILHAREKRIAHLKIIEDSMRDLGLVRWNYALRPKEKQEVNEILEELTNSDEDSVLAVASKIATKMEQARHYIRDCQLACAILWALGRYQEIVELVNECNLENKECFPESLTILKFAAMMRYGLIDKTNERDFIINNVIKILAEAKETKRRKGILLGAGYILYHAWRQEMFNASIVDRQLEKQPVKIRSWASLSFDLGEEAYNTFKKNTLGWAFAINHCAYVGIVTGVQSEKSIDFIQKLFKLKIYEKIWSPRFDDTIGCYFLIRAEQLWAFCNEIDKPHLSIDNEINNARKYLQAAKKFDPGDIDIDEHLGRIDVLANTYYDYKKSIS